MNEFLRQVAACYHRELGRDVGECCFVFPNRRSALFFRKYLGQCAGGPVLAPRLMSINDLFSELSGLETVGKIPALDMLYRRYAELMWPGAEPKESFDDFVFWGDTLLNDFDDVDKYMVDARGLFTNIDDLYGIDAGDGFLSDTQRDAIRQFWGEPLKIRTVPEESRLDKRAEFRRVWNILFSLYESFRGDLKARGLAYEGMIYREVAEGLKEKGSPVFGRLDRFRGYRRIVFVGLNALNECEKMLLDTLTKECETDFYWDFYGPMITDLDNKASKFLPENVAKYHSRHRIDPAMAEKQEYRSIAVPSGVGQTRLTCSLLENIAARQGFVAEETAVILPDENLLMPMLGAIPESVQDINVTMGFPLSASNVATFLRMLDRLHRNCRIKDGGAQFYHRDVIALLTHPFIRKGLSPVEEGGKETAADKLVAAIRRNNIIYSPEEDFASDALLGTLFRKVEETADLPEYLHSVIALLQERLDKLDREFIYHLDKCVTSLTNYGLEIEKSTFFKLLGRLAEVIKVQFSGEPLKGLQIMGPLETRALDFKNIIILSANEGTFPKRSVSNSFIPYTLRKGFGLPTYEFQDAISAYHFYRSICRAESVTLIYDSRTEGINVGEESRYIKQLKFHYGVPVSEETASYIMGEDASVLAANSVEKDEKVMALLEGKFLNGNGHFSASSLNNYLKCPLKFYYSNVLRISEADEVSEGLDAGMFGKVFHKSMENLYDPYAGRVVTEQVIKGFSEEIIGRIVDDTFRTECMIREVAGRNLIVRNLIIRFMLKVLEVDAGRAPFTYVKGEQKMSFPLRLDDGRTVTVFGVIDRLDRHEGLTHIIDYKTGRVDGKATVREVGDMFDRSKSDRPEIALQMYLYLLLALGGEASEKCGNYILSVYALRDIYSGLPGEEIVDQEDLAEFKSLLAGLVSEILDPAVPFSPCEEGSKTCEYCDFRKLCNRWTDSRS